MLEIHNNNKFWSWTEAEKRRRSHARYWVQGAPKYYVRKFNVHNRLLGKRLIKRHHIDEIDTALFPFQHRHQANWDFW